MRAERQRSGAPCGRARKVYVNLQDRNELAEGNDTLAVFDLESHQAIAHLPMAKGSDVAGRHRPVVADSRRRALSVLPSDAIVPMTAIA